MIYSAGPCLEQSSTLIIGINGGTRLDSAVIKDDPFDNLILDDVVFIDFASFCRSNPAAVSADSTSCFVSFVVSRRNMLLLVDFRATVDTRVGVAGSNADSFETVSILSDLSEEIMLP